VAARYLAALASAGSMLSAVSKSSTALASEPWFAYAAPRACAGESIALSATLVR
jgi:hypothetical protein